MAQTSTHNIPGNTPLAKPRMEFIDTAKGICILLVLLLHCGFSTGRNDFFDLLRMPCFFTISGFLFKDYGGFIPTSINKCNRILIPFLFFYILSYLDYALYCTISGKEIIISFFAMFTDKEYIVNGALWFLQALFWSNIYFYILHRIFPNKIALGIASLSLSILAIVLFSGDTKLPLFLDAGFVALPYLFLGYFLRSNDLLLPNRLDRYNWWFILILLSISVLCFIIGDEANIFIGAAVISGSPIMFFIGSLTIVLATLLLCKNIGTIPFISYVGRYSLIIFAIDHIVRGKVTLCGIKLFGMDPTNTLHATIFFILTVLISAALIAPLTRYLPWFTAQRDLINLSSKKLQNTRIYKK